MPAWGANDTDCDGWKLHLSSSCCRFATRKRNSWHCGVAWHVCQEECCWSESTFRKAKTRKCISCAQFIMKANVKLLKWSEKASHDTNLQKLEPSLTKLRDIDPESKPTLEQDIKKFCRCLNFSGLLYSRGQQWNAARWLTRSHWNTIIVEEISVCGPTPTAETEQRDWF